MSLGCKSFRRVPHFAVLISLVLLNGPIAAQDRGSHRPQDFISFSRFLSESREKKFEDFPRQPNVRVRDEAAFEEMKGHLLSLYDGVRVKQSFFETGHYVDCVPVAQQPSLKGEADAKPPARAATPTQPPKGQKGGQAPGKTQTLNLTLTGKKDAFGHKMACPARTIPIRRVTLEDIVRFSTLSQFLRGRKVDDGSLDRQGDQRPADGGHYYARGVQFIDNFGADAWLNVWSPKVASEEMSLSQLWVVGSEGEE